ncbi:MAG: LCP family protein [Bacteroidota bacterium]
MRRSSRSDGWLYVLLIGSFLLFTSGLVAYLTLGQKGAPALRLTELTRIINPMSRTNILIMGSDRTQNESDTYGRSDTLLLVGLDPAKGKINLLSIPRDTMVTIPGHRGHDKVNAALAYGGPDLAMKTVSEFLGVPIDYWIRLKLDGLIHLVDLLGGVKVFVEQDMTYTDRTGGLKIRIPEGWRDMDGSEAHQYVRFRHDAMGDIGRVRRQQHFMQAVMEKLLQPGTILRYPQLVNGVMQNVQTNLTSVQLLQYANWARTVDKRRIRMVMLPGEFSAGRTRVSYWLTEPERVKDLGARMFTDQSLSALVEDSPETRMKFRIAVLNGTAHPGLANSAARILRDNGWTIWGVGDADRRDYTSTQVIAQNGDDDLTDLLGRSLGVRAEPSNLNLGDVQTDFTIVLGEDFAQAMRIRVR